MERKWANYPSLGGKKVLLTGGVSGICAARVLFVSADDGAMCTGQEFFVDAGWS